jgi:hypothetical protein
MVMCNRSARSVLRTKAIDSSQLAGKRIWKNTEDVAICTIGGAKVNFTPDDLDLISFEKLGVWEMHILKKLNRVIIRCTRYYSADYSRMQRRICNSVLLKDGQCGLVQFFVLNSQSNMVFAVILLLVKETEYPLSAGRYLQPVVVSETHHTCCVDEIKESLVDISVAKNSKIYVACAPNSYGHSICKYNLSNNRAATMHNIVQAHYKYVLFQLDVNF